VSQKKGKPFSRKAVAADVRALMKLGFFSDVVVEERGDPTRPTLVFHVTEKPEAHESGSRMGARRREELPALGEWNGRVPCAVDQEESGTKRSGHAHRREGTKHGLDLLRECLQGPGDIGWGPTREESGDGPARRAETSFEAGVFQGVERAGQGIREDPPV